MFKEDNYYKITLIISVIIAIIWVYYIKTTPYSDFNFYFEAAKSIAKGKSWGNTYTTMGYPIFLAFLFKIFGISINIIKISNIILYALSSVMILFILKKLYISENDRKIIFLLYILFPGNIFYTSLVATEIFFNCIMIGIIALYYSTIRLKWLLIGILTAIGAMTKPFFIVFPILFFIVESLYNRKLVSSIKNILIVLFVAVICISPWIYRNTKLMGRFTYVSNNGGIVLYLNNNSYNHVGRWIDPDSIPHSILNTNAYKDANMTEKNIMASNAAKSWILTHKLNFVYLGFLRLANTYLLGDDVVYSLYNSGIHLNTMVILFLISNIVKYFVFSTAIVAVIFNTIKLIYDFIKQRKIKITNSSLLFLLIFYFFSSVYFVTEGQSRYSFPLYFIAIYFAYFLLKQLIILSLRGARL